VIPQSIRRKQQQLCIARIYRQGMRCTRCDNLYLSGVIPVSNLCIDFCEICNGLARDLTGVTHPVVVEA
jgi:hypothetical protein